MSAQGNKRSSSDFGHFVRSSKKKRWQRVIFTILAAILGVGLVGSSMFYAFTGNPSENQEYTGNEQIVGIAQQITDLETKLSTDNNNTDLMMQLAGLYQSQGDNSKAIEMYNQALTLKPDDVELHKSVGQAYFFMGDYEQAVGEMQQAITLNPEDAYAHYYAGQFCAFRSDGQRDVAKGISELETFIELQKEGADVDQAKQYIKDLKASQND